MGVVSGLKVKVKSLNITLIDVLWFIYLIYMNTYYSTPRIPMLFVLGIAFMSVLTMFKRSFTRFGYYLKQLNIFFIYLAFFIYVLASSLWRMSPRVASASLENEMFRLVLLFFSLGIYCTDWEKCKRMMYMILFTTAYFAIVYLVTSPVKTYGTTNMGGITFIWRNTASYTGMSVGFLGVYLIGQSKKMLTKILVIASIGICIVMALITGSRKGIFQIVLYFGLYVVLQKGLAQKIKAIAIIVILVLLGVYIIQQYEFLGYAYIERMMGIFDKSYDDGSVEARDFLMQTGIDIFKQRPIFGAGADAVRSYLGYAGNKNVSYSHSNYIELLASFGIVGTLIYYWYFLKQTIFALFNKNKDKDRFLIYAAAILITMFILDYVMMTYNIRQNIFLLFFIVRCIEVKRKTIK